MSAQPLASRHDLSLEAEIGAPLEFSDLRGDLRRSIPTLGGRFSGARSGQMREGTDGQIQHADGSLQIKAHDALETDEGLCSEISSVGLRTAAPGASARLNRMLAVSRAERVKAGAGLTIFEIL